MPWSTPAIIFLIVAALRGGGTGTLADAALRESIRRALTPAATRSMTMTDLPPGAARPMEPEPPVKPVVLPEKDPDAAKPDPKEAELTEADWRALMTTARADLKRDETLADAMQGRVNGLNREFVNRDDPAQRAEIQKQRINALEELDRLIKQIEKDKLAIAGIEEDARKKGIPPGWIR